MNRKMLLIINPISGSGHKDNLAERITAVLARKGIDVDTERTTCSGDATRLARLGVERGVDAVLACGGDGTVNETARALCDTGMPMGIIPAGSGNGLARHLSIPVDPIVSLDIIAEGRVEDCDYGTVNGRPFFCTFGMGFDAAVSDRFAASGQRGKISYVRSAIEEFLRFHHEHYTIHVDDRVITDDAFLVACCNASQYGNNAYIAPKASITDGVLDMVIVRKANILETAMIGVDLMAGTIHRNRIIETIPVRNATIVREGNGPAHIDGEPVSLGDRLTVECHHGGLRLLIPTDRDEFHPLLTPAEDLLRDINITLNNLLGRTGA